MQLSKQWHSDALRACLSLQASLCLKCLDATASFGLPRRKAEGGNYLTNVDESDFSLVPGRYKWVKAHPRNREYSTGLNIRGKGVDGLAAGTSAARPSYPKAASAYGIALRQPA